MSFAAMLPPLDGGDDESTDEDEAPRRGKIFLARKNLLETMSDEDLIKRFRFDRDTIMVIFDDNS